MVNTPQTGIVRFAGRLIVSAALSLFLLFSVTSAQTPGEGTPPRPSRRSIRPILIAVEFQGNTVYTAGDLEGVIRSRATSIPQLERFARLAYDNPLAPKGTAYLIYDFVDELRDIRYLNTAWIADDTTNIKEVYEGRGYHFTTVRAQIGIDTALNVAVLRFTIDEGPQSTIRGVRIEGVESTPPDLQRQIGATEFLLPGEPYDVENVTLENQRIVGLLRDNGYPFAIADVQDPNVVYFYPPEFDAYTDSVILYVYPDQRYRFGETEFLRAETDHGTPVDEGLKRLQIEYNEGDWYSWSRVNETQANLYRLGVFEFVRSDTSAALTHGDTLGLRFATSLRDQNEVTAAWDLSLAQRSLDRVLKLGLSGSYTRLNLLGHATRGTIGGRVQIVPNLGRLTRVNEFEWGVNGRLDWPNPLNIRKLGASLYSDVASAIEDRVGDELLRSFSVNLAPELTYSFPSYTAISGLTGRLTYHYAKYTNVESYLQASASSRVSGTTLPKGCDSAVAVDRIAGALARSVYRIQVLQGDAPGLAPSAAASGDFDALKHTLSFGLTATGDRRNNFFSPSKGYYVQTSIDFGLTGFNPIGLVGSAQFTRGAFIKAEFDYRQYRRWGRESVLATRAHVGSIGQFGEFPLTPVSYRFWAGGATSNRGWGSRDLLVTTRPALSDDSCVGELIDAILRDNRRLFGGLAIIQLNAELRVPMSRYFVTDFFIDVGSAFFRNYSDDKELTNQLFSTIVENLATSIGAELGYYTPVGPVRLGFGYRLYDPVYRSSGTRWFFEHNPALNDVHFFFSIGHAF